MDGAGIISKHNKPHSHIPVWSVVLLLFIVGVVARALHLETLPLYIHNDESATAIYITPPFFTDPPDPIMWGQNNYGGHANFGAWLASLYIRAFGGKTLWAIRMGSMVCGVLSILFGALFVRSWLGLRAMMFFLVGVVPFHLHVHFSRTGFIYIQAVLLLSVVAFCFARFARKPSMFNGLLLGLTTGFALMVYSATHVLVGVIPIGVIAVLCSRTAKECLHGARLLKTAGVLVAIGAGLGLSLGQLVYQAYNSGFSSRLEHQSIFREVVRQDVSHQLGREASFFDVVVSHFNATLSFFWVGDSSVQYGLVTNPLAIVPSWALLLGFVVLLFRCSKFDSCAIFILTLAVGTVVGSSLIVERNFAPHLVAFGLILPVIAAVALETACRVTRISSPRVAAFMAIGLFIPWANWNYGLYTDLDRSKRNFDTFVLHLPIQRESVKKIVNYSALHMDLAESFYMLRYPNAKVLEIGAATTGDIPTQVSQLMESAECPCIVVVPVEQHAGVVRVVESSRRIFREFPKGAPEVNILYVE